MEGRHGQLDTLLHPLPHSLFLPAPYCLWSMSFSSVVIGVVRSRGKNTCESLSLGTSHVSLGWSILSCLWQRDSPETPLLSPCKSPLSRFPFLLSPPLSSPTASETLEFWFLQSVLRPFHDLIVLPVHLSHPFLLVSLQDFSVYSHYNMLAQFTPAEYLLVLCLIPLSTPSCSSIGEVGRRPDGPQPPQHTWPRYRDDEPSLGLTLTFLPSYWQSPRCITRRVSASHCILLPKHKNEKNHFKFSPDIFFFF